MRTDRRTGASGRGHANKPLLEIAPVPIAIFAQRVRDTADGEAVKNDYVNESVGIAAGFLIAALHGAGLATDNPFLLLAAGHPAPGCMVPVQGGIKKTLADVADWRWWRNRAARSNEASIVGQEKPSDERVRR